MKVGFILECRPKGPDADIYPYLAKVFCPNLQLVKPETLINKPRLMNEGPLVAQTLIADGCDYVFIIWDRKPPWHDKLNNCDSDKELLNNSLLALGVDITRIFLCCIDEMLESWLIADGRGLMSWIRSKTNHTLPEFGDHKTKAEQTSPKDRIRNYLRDNFAKWKYNEYEDNFDIAKMLPDLNRASKWNSSFRHFKESIELICPN